MYSCENDGMLHVVLYVYYVAPCLDTGCYGNTYALKLCGALSVEHTRYKFCNYHLCETSYVYCCGEQCALNAYVAGSLEGGREGDVALSPAGKGAAIMHHAD